MSRFNSIVIITLLLFGLFQACKQEKVEPSVMYEASELAQLMRNMHDTLESWKTIIEKDSSASFSLPEELLAIHSAEATNPGEIDQTFHTMADGFTQRMEILINSDSTNLHTNFNSSVRACVTCHQSFCSGPIPKIEKLYIAE